MLLSVTYSNIDNLEQTESREPNIKSLLGRHQTTENVQQNNCCGYSFCRREDQVFIE